MLKKNESARSLASFQACIAEELPQSVETHLQLASAAIAAKAWETALQSLAFVKERGSVEQLLMYHRYTTIALIEQEKIPEAEHHHQNFSIDLIERARKEFSHLQQEAYQKSVRRVESFLQSSKELIEARKFFLLLQKDPNIDKKTREIELLYKEGRYAKAEALATETIKFQPSNIPLLVMYTKIWLALRDNAAAYNTLQRIFELNPDHQEASLLHGRVCLRWEINCSAIDSFKSLQNSQNLVRKLLFLWLLRIYFSEIFYKQKKSFLAFIYTQIGRYNFFATAS